MSATSAMGNTPSAQGAMNRAIFQLRMKRRGMEAEEKKSRRAAALARQRVMTAMKRGDDAETVRQYAESVAQHDDAATQYRKIAARLETAALCVQRASSMHTMSVSMRDAVHALASASEAIPLMQVMEIMSSFDKQVEDTQVQSSAIETAMKESTQHMAPASRVDEIIQKVGDAHSLETTQFLINAPFGGLPATTTTTTVPSAQDVLGLPSVPTS